MAQFPLDKFVFQVGSVDGDAADEVAMEIPIEPFQLDGEVVDTSIHLDGIELPSAQVEELVGKTFEFPTNPDDGYIDGSIAIGHAHHPIDVTKMTFREAKQGKVNIAFEMEFQFEFEGLANNEDEEYENATLARDAWLEWSLETE